MLTPSKPKRKGAYQPRRPQTAKRYRRPFRERSKQYQDAYLQSKLECQFQWWRGNLVKFHAA